MAGVFVSNTAHAQAELDTVTLTRTGAASYNLTATRKIQAGTPVNRILAVTRRFQDSSANCSGTMDFSDLELITPGDPVSFNAEYIRTITGNSGKYICVRGQDGNDSTTTYSVVGPLTYSGPTLTLNSAGADNEYVTGDHIEVTAAFGYSVDVDTTNGTPRIALTIGSNTRYATYNSGTGTGNLVFRYTVVAADVDSDGISIAANALSLNSGTIQDSSNTDAVITHAALAASSNHKVNPPVNPPDPPVNTDGPTVTITPSAYSVINDITKSVTLLFSEKVYKDTQKQAFTASDIKTIITLKRGGPDGTAIAYTVIPGTGTNANRSYTLNPSSDFTTWDSIYVAVSHVYYDEDGNQGNAHTSQFKVDALTPSPQFEPANGATTNKAWENIALYFVQGTEADLEWSVFSDTQQTPFTPATAQSLLTLKETDADGDDIAFTVTVHGNQWFIDPVDDLPEGDVYVAITNGYYDEPGNQGIAGNATFTLADSSTDATLAFTGKPVTVSHTAGNTTGCLDVSEDKAYVGTAVVGYLVRTAACDNSAAQTWRVERRTQGPQAGTYTLVSGVTSHGGRYHYCLDNWGTFRVTSTMAVGLCRPDAHPEVARQALSLTASGTGYVLTFTGGPTNTIVWAGRDSNTAQGPVSQQSAASGGGRAIWQIVETNPVQGSSLPPDPDEPQQSDVPVQPVVVQIPPPALSVADATVIEGAGAQLAFTVSLDRAVLASDGLVSVAYATRDGTAIAGADYTATSGTLTFALDEQTKTVNVTVLDDAHPDDGETLDLVLSNATGATIADGTGTGTIENVATIPRAWSARFGRTVGTHITDAVSARLRDTGAAASHLTVAGWRMPLGSRQAQGGTSRQASATRQASASEQTGTLLTGLAGLLGLNGPTGGAQGLTPGNSRNGPVGGNLNGTPWLNGSFQQQNPGQALNLPDFRQALIGSAFRLNLNQSADGTIPRLTAWGRVTHTQFDGQEGRLALDGDVLTGTLGVDTQGDRWLAGIAVSHSRGDGGYTIPDQANPGDLETTLTSLHPYLRYALTDRLTVWGLVGYGWGDLTLTQTDGTAIDTDTDFLMGAVGSRGLLLDPATTGGFQLATRLDAMFTRTSTDAVATADMAAADMAATDADAHRLRLVLEGSRRMAWDEGRVLTPTVEVGLRHDWGDAETGFGVEVGGRVQYADPTLGLTVEGAVRGLVAHEAEAYDEWGASGTVRLAPGVNGQGLALTLQPAWGATASGVEALWGRQSTAGLAPRANQVATGRLAAEVGYGVPAFDTGLVMPYAGTVLAEGASRTYRVGTRLVMPGQGALGLTMTLEGLRTEPTGLQPLNQGLRLQATWGF